MLGINSKHRKKQNETSAAVQLKTEQNLAATIHTSGKKKEKNKNKIILDQAAKMQANNRQQ